MPTPETRCQHLSAPVSTSGADTKTTITTREMTPITGMSALSALFQTTYHNKLNVPVFRKSADNADKPENDAKNRITMRKNLSAHGVLTDADTC